MGIGGKVHYFIEYDYQAILILGPTYIQEEKIIPQQNKLKVFFSIFSQVVYVKNVILYSKCKLINILTFFNKRD